MAVARVTKITASSPTSFHDAVQEGLIRAAQTLRGITGLEVISQKAKVEYGRIAEYRVTLEVTFILESAPEAAAGAGRQDEDDRSASFESMRSTRNPAGDLLRRGFFARVSKTPHARHWRRAKCSSRSLIVEAS